MGSRECTTYLKSGILPVYSYGGYRVRADTSGVVLAFCWAHVRRRFYDLAGAGPASIASEALQRIAELYKARCRSYAAAFQTT